jgi:outer membrane protein TolC
MDRALRRRPGLSALRWAVQAARAQVEAAARTNSPTVSVGMEYDGSSQTGSTFDNQWNANLQVSVPILDGGEARLQRLVALEALEQARQALISSRRSVLLDVASAYANLVSLWQQRAIAAQTVEEAREALSIAELRYRMGISSNVELLSSQQAFISARQTLANVTLDYRAALVAWRRSISGDWPVTLPPELVTEWELPPEEPGEANP